MAEIGWGHLKELEIFGRIQNEDADFEEIPYVGVEQAFPISKYKHAGHCMIFCRDETLLWNLYARKAKVLMQLRFDGVIGFPGGLVDEGEGPVEAVNRELWEEAAVSNDQLEICETDHVVSYYNKPKDLILHFFSKEVSNAEFEMIEKGILHAQEYGVETCGIIQVPVYTMGDGIRGLPAFLKNRFSGNARQQLLYALEHHNILSKTEIAKAIVASQSL